MNTLSSFIVNESPARINNRPILLDTCETCKKQVGTNQIGYHVYKVKYGNKLGDHYFVCSEVCSEMFILQHIGD